MRLRASMKTSVSRGARVSKRWNVSASDCSTGMSCIIICFRIVSVRFRRNVTNCEYRWSFEVSFLKQGVLGSK
jgi:hypothetical protein